MGHPNMEVQDIFYIIDSALSLSPYIYCPTANVSRRHSGPYLLTVYQSYKQEKIIMVFVVGLSLVSDLTVPNM